MAKKIIKLFIVLASLLILNSRRRAEFQNKYFQYLDALSQIKNYEKRINQLEHVLANHQDGQKIDRLEHNISEYLKRSQSFLDNSSIIDFSARKALFKQRFKKRFEITDAEHQKNTEGLFLGLDEQATEHLLAILNRLEKFSSDYLCSTYSELFTDVEKKALMEYENFEHQIKKVDDYYQYLDFKLPVNYFDPSAFPRLHGLANLKTFKDIGDKAIMDVGALFGESVLAFRNYCSAPIFSFEPSAYNFNIAAKTLKLNNVHGVHLENIALSNFAGIATLDGWKLSRQNNVGDKIVVNTLDKYVSEHNINVGLIKVDVEGGEMDFLHGALETIKVQKPILMLSIYHSYDDFYKIKPFIEQLNLGYKFDFYQSIDKYIISEILLFCEVY